jgi:hypothetical protein
MGADATARMAAIQDARVSHARLRMARNVHEAAAGEREVVGHNTTE